ncbi:hypothetical protein ACOJBQ_001591 [Cronobacter muytjensii]
MNNDELIAAGHELAKCLDSNTPLIDIAKMIVRLADKLDVTTLALREKTRQCEKVAQAVGWVDSGNFTLAEAVAGHVSGLKAATQRSEELAAENAAIKALNDCLSEELRGYESDGAFEGPKMHLLWWKTETPATDAFLREVRASVIPEGYALVPQQIFLDPSDIESICSQCGDGHKSGYGDFTDGLLWVGNIQRDDGSIVHGLHISSADYSEEGGVTVCEFAAQLRQGGAA